MTVMMIGLVAMLGANAEAHTRWFKGRPFVCSICSDAKDTELREVLEDPRSIFAVAELVVKTQKARILCPDKTEVQVNEELTLVGETPSAAWQGWTEDNKTARVALFVSDQVLGFCVDQKGELVPPFSMQILKMSATYNAYECTGPDRNPCSSKVLISSMKLKNCQVPRNASVGTYYVCNAPVFEHVL